MTTLYLGPTTLYATAHASDRQNAAVQLAPHSHLANGTFAYNIYVSTLFDGTNLFDAVVRLYVGSPTPLGLMSPGWFLNAQFLKRWNLTRVGMLAGVNVPPAIPVANITWDAVTDADNNNVARPSWTPGVDSPQIGNSTYALVATLEYNGQTIHTGSLTADPLAAVYSSLAIP